MKEKDLKFFFGDVKKLSNKYFEYNSIIDEDNIVLLTNNIKQIKDSFVLIVNNNQAVYLKDWQIREVHNYDLGINTYAVKLNRKYFRPYTFRFEFDGFDFEKADTFDSLAEIAETQTDPIALGYMH